MDRHLTIEAVRLTEAAALFASRHMGKGDEEIAYLSAADAMHRVLSYMNIYGEIVIGADSPDSLLHDGVLVGNSDDIAIDLALKPLDGKSTCAKGGHNAVSVVAVSDKGAFMKVPSLYMDKIAVGKDAKNVVDINQPPSINIKRVARAMGKYIEDITVCVLDRKRNERLVEEIRKTGARIRFIQDGDITGAISTAVEIAPVISPSWMKRILAPVFRISSTSRSFLFLSSTQTVISSMYLPMARATRFMLIEGG